MDRKMIELDKKLANDVKQKELDRDATARRLRAETIEQELQLKKLANYKKVSTKFQLHFAERQPKSGGRYGKEDASNARSQILG